MRAALALTDISLALLTADLWIDPDRGGLLTAAIRPAQNERTHRRRRASRNWSLFLDAAVS